MPDLEHRGEADGVVENISHGQTLFGPRIEEDGIQFNLWAPSAVRAHIALEDMGTFAMQPAGDGFYRYRLADGQPGQKYMFECAGHRFPDPASRLQEDGPESWSIAVAEKRRGTQHPPPIAWREAVICEVHVGTVSPEGTFEGLRKRLPYFAGAGYNVLEILPVVEFSGHWGWGYDGVLPFAIKRDYGSRAEFRALIEDAHRHGIAIVLDVVYNHFGPKGNFLPAYAGDFFTREFTTPWGDAIAFGNPLVRTFFLENLRMWLADFDLDGLRFDAVQSFQGEGGVEFLAELVETSHAISPRAFLILENDNNAASLIAAHDDDRQAFTAQWNDDFHHAIHVLATGETDGYYVDYAGDPIGKLRDALAEGFSFQGQYSKLRKRPRGEPSAALHPTSFVAFLQNHDQVANRGDGERLTVSVDQQRLTLIRFLQLLSPEVPLFFMGEEAFVKTPFPYFCDFAGELGEAVRKSREAEAREHARHAELCANGISDPCAKETFEHTKLPWEWMEGDQGATALANFRLLARARARYVAPLLKSKYRGADAVAEGRGLCCKWNFDAGSYAIAINLGDAPLTVERAGEARVIQGSVERDGKGWQLGAWSGVMTTPEP